MPHPYDDPDSPFTPDPFLDSLPPPRRPEPLQPIRGCFSDLGLIFLAALFIAGCVAILVGFT